MGSPDNHPNPSRHRRFSGVSFRSRLSWSVVILVAVAVASTAFYTFYRTGVTNKFLTDQINTSVLGATEQELSSTATRHASELDNFFSSVSYNMKTLGMTVQSFLNKEPDTNESWNARSKLARLSSGNWDNANTEAGSIFIPAKDELSNALVTEINSLKRMDFIAPSVLANNPDMIALYFGSMVGETMYYPNVDLSAILPPDFDITQRPWFVAAAPDLNQAGEVVWSDPYQDAALNGLVVTSSLPIYDASGKFRGVIAADLQLIKISNLVSSIHVGQTGYAFLIDGKGRVIAMPETGYADFGLTASDFEGEQALDPIFDKVPSSISEILNKMTNKLNGMETINVNGVDKYITYQPIPSIGYSLGIVVPVSETQETLISTREKLASESQGTLINIILSTLLLLAIAFLVSRFIGNALARPLVQLTNTATRLADGDLSAEVQSHSHDEFGVLANAFNVMTTRLRELVASLEQRVAERTVDLEKESALSSKRAEDLQVVSEVARAVSTEVNLENLLTLVTEVVSKRFGFYHVGVFLLDNVNKNAILRASNSPGGKRMIARGHKLAIGQVGIVGHVAATGEARIALDVGEDATFFNNPDLPETRSEMALPLRVGEYNIGVLDVQSTQPNAFTQTDVHTLSILADQVAIAIENARLLEESQQALAESQAQYNEFISRVWEQKTALNPIGYQHSAGTGNILEETIDWEEIHNAFKTGSPVITEGEDASIPAMAVPIRLHDQVIGILDIRSPEAGRIWTEDDIAIVEAVAERLALALENARLFEETSGRAAREHAVADITTKIRETNDPQAMIRTAIQELQHILNVSRVEIIPQVVSANLPGREKEKKINE